MVIDVDMYMRIAQRRITLQSWNTTHLKSLLAETQAKWLAGEHTPTISDTITAILTIFKHRNVPY